MKSLIKKLLRESLLRETPMQTAQEVGLSDKIFYHGTHMKIDKLDPEFRGKNKEALKFKGSTSAKGDGLGIYFSPNLGFDPNNLTYTEDGGVLPTSGVGATKENAYKWAMHSDNRLGYIYKMKLKPTANIVDVKYDEVDDINHRLINRDQYDKLIKLGVDGVSGVGGSWGGEHEFILLNPNAVEKWGLAYKVVDKFKVGLRKKRGSEEIDKGSAKILNKEEVEPYLKELLGDKYFKVGRESTCKEGGCSLIVMYSNGEVIALVKQVPHQIESV